MVELSESRWLIASRKVDQLYRECRAKSVGKWGGQLRKGSSVLDVGAGDCYYSKRLSEAGFDVLSLDVDANNLTRRDKYDGFKGKKVVADATKMPFVDNSFEGAICIEVIEHVECPYALLREISRVIKPNSYCLLTTPNGGRLIMRILSPLGVTLLISSHHKREYTINEVLSLIAEIPCLEVCRIFTYALDLPTLLLRPIPKFILKFFINLSHTRFPILYKFFVVLLVKM